MSTFTYEYNQGSGSLIEVLGTATVTYTRSVTDTGVTVALSNVSIYNNDAVKHTYNYAIKLGGTTVASGTISNVASHGSKSKSLSVSRTIERTHTSQSKQLAGGGGVSGESGVTTDGSASISVPARPSYNVYYFANGGSGAPADQTKWYDESLTLSASKPTRSNYVFRRWNTSTADTGTAYNPSASYTANAELSLYAIWNPIIRYEANGSGVGSMPSAQTKTYGVAISLSSNVPTRSGYQFDGWYANSSGTGTKYTPGQSYTSNDAITLYAKWLKVPDAPRITSLTTVRCDSGGTQSDTGTYCKVTAQWSVDTTSDTVPSNTGTVTGTIKRDGTSTTTAITFSSGSSGTSGTAVAIVSGCSVDYQYLVTVTVTDAVTSTSRSDVLTRAKFTMDFAAGGDGIGVGCASPQSGFECGWDAQFDRDVTVLGDISAANLAYSSNTTIADIISASGTWTVYSASFRRWGRVAQLLLVVRNSSAMNAGGNTVTVGNLKAACRPQSYTPFGGGFGGGEIGTTGDVTFKPFVDVGANTAFYIGATYFVA